MSAEDILKASERSAITTNVTGKAIAAGSGSKFKSFGAIGLITLMIVVFAMLFSFGNLIPAAISERLIEATDVQYADAVESKILVFQQALASGEVPANTVKRLEAQGIKVDGTSLIFKGKTIPAGNFVTEVKGDINLYKAFTAATYDRAAYYYDESAEMVFKKIGTNRDNYTASSDFDAVMTGLVGKGSNINVSTVGLVEKTDEKGKKYTEYEVIGEKASSGTSAEEFVKMVAENNLDEDEGKATMDATTALNNADIMSKEQKSAIFFMAFMENISKMKAGEGSNSKINEAMNYLFREQESSVVDVKTGEEIKVKGSMLESPSLYAILSGEKVNVNDVTNYASDRVLKTVGNKAGFDNVSDETRNSTVTSTGEKNKGTIGRYLFSGETAANYDSLSAATPTLNSSLVENGFETIGGVYGGEMLVEGAVNVGRMLAKTSGSTVGDGDSVKEYAKVTSDILAMDKEVDRMNRSPFDITSPNTFLGSIVHKLAFSNIFKVFGGSMTTKTFADNNENDYLTSFGNCETIGSIGGVGTATCSEIDTFDTSTLNDTFHNDEFNAFVEENTELEGGVRKVKKNSVLADFIKYNNERITPIGVMDGGILEAISKESSSIPFISNIISLIKAWLGASEEDKAIATGKVFVNSTSNPDWEKYKYAQRYVSLARATDALRQYDGDETAYSNLKYFEGSENPVIAFLTEYYNELANNYRH
ncbi:hypothetical protein J6S55_00570 [Candidatus Saccharibacteria bacterium]|nr:hypothetical protein [Candidatus Saccharibacteria bacterium]